MKNNTELSILCHNVKAIRQEHKLSKAKMAKILGIGVHTLTLLEKGIIPERLSSKFLFSFEKPFGIGVLELLSGMIELKDKEGKR